MTERELRLLRYRIAELSIGASTLRRQGAKRVVEKARAYLKRIRLRKYSVNSRSDFLAVLNAETNRLRRYLPYRARNWGAARKALNIFLCSTVYNRHLCGTYRLAKIERFLEVPLDSYVGKALRRSSEGASLPRWRSVKGLTKRLSDQYQTVARQIARRKKMLPVHLDLHYFRRPEARL